MARSLHESYDSGYKGGLKAARRTALRRQDRAVAAEALEAMEVDPAEDDYDLATWILDQAWFPA